MIAMVFDLDSVAFWICAPIIVLLGLGMVLARKPVHSALCLAGVMVALGVLYASLTAPFLFVAQLIVYTGSVMMLFLFTMMLIGVDTAEQVGETIRGQRGAAIIAVLGLVALLVFTIGHGIVGQPVGVSELNQAAGGNAQAVAQVLFGRFAVAFEAASALVITAALAAMVLAHADRTAPKERQRERVARRLREYSELGIAPAPQPAPGVYARHNAATYPALLPNGQDEAASVAAALRARGQDVVGGAALTKPVGLLHNQLADQAAQFDDQPMLRANVAQVGAIESAPPGPPDGEPAPVDRPKRGEG